MVGQGGKRTLKETFIDRLHTAQYTPLKSFSGKQNLHGEDQFDSLVYLQLAKHIEEKAQRRPACDRHNGETFVRLIDDHKRVSSYF